MYGRALSGEEIADLLTDGPQAGDHELRAWYTFDGGSAADLSGNANHGTLCGGVSEGGRGRLVSEISPEGVATKYGYTYFEVLLK